MWCTLAGVALFSLAAIGEPMTFHKALPRIFGLLSITSAMFGGMLIAIGSIVSK